MISPDQQLQDEPAYQVRIGATTYPVDRSAPPDDSRPDAPRGQPERGELHESIEDAFWIRLSFDRVSSAGFTDHDHLMQVSTDDLARLIRATEEVRHLVETTCDVNVEFTAEGDVHKPTRDDALRKVKQAMLGRVAADLRPNGSVWDPQIDEMKLEDAAIEVRQRLRRAVGEFVDRFVDLLDDMVTTELLGLIRWYTPTSSDMFFYREILIQQGVDFTTFRSQKHAEVLHSDNLRVVTRRTMEVRTVVRAAHELRHAVYSMKLRKAGKENIDRSSLLIPRSVQPLLNAIPEWLRPLVQIVDGQRYDTRIVARKVSDVVTKHQTVSSETETDVIHHDPLPHHDPAITLGRYVLTGWGPEEIEAEEKLRAEDQRDQDRRAASGVALVWFYPALGVALLLVAAGLGLTTLGITWRPMLAIGYAATLCGAAACVLPLKLAQVARRRSVTWPFLICGTVAAIAAGSAMQLATAAVLLRSSPLGVAAGVSLGLAVVATAAMRRIR